jgi:hypothetical protein
VLAVTRFEGLAPTDPPTSDVLLVSYTYLVDDDGRTAAFPSWSTPLPPTATTGDLADAEVAGVVAEAAVQGFTLAPGDIVAATTYAR